MSRRVLFAVFLSGVTVACGPPVTPVFPADYSATYAEVRPCTQSADHALNFVKVLADPVARPTYEKRRDTGAKDAYPVGSALLKEEHPSAACDDLVKWTVMKKAPAGTADDALGWVWQEVDAQRNVSTKPVTSCIGCHRSCPESHEGSCALPP